MRLWSIHPKYLDWVGLGALWRESLLAREVLRGNTKGWKNHPQLNRLKTHETPLLAIEYYLQIIFEESLKRGYKYNSTKIRSELTKVKKTNITLGQLKYEFKLLMIRTEKRTPDWYEKLIKMEISNPEPHPLFIVEEGKPELWEISYWRLREGVPIDPSLSSHHRATANNFDSS
jgi:hypothetical protein